MAAAALRRLIDLPGVADLEYRALMKRDFADPEARAEHPEIDACITALFGLSADEADALPRPEDWDSIENKPPLVQVGAAEPLGWDLTDDKRRPLRMLGNFAGPFWLAARGIAGALPFAPEPQEDESWIARLEADAKRFTKR